MYKLLKPFMSTYLSLVICLLITSGCINDEVPECYFKEIISKTATSENHEGFSNSFDVKATINTNIKKIADLNIDIVDSLRYRKINSEKISSHIEYATDDVLVHNKIVSTLCMKYALFKDPSASEEIKRQIEVELVDNINKYYEFLITAERKPTPTSVLTEEPSSSIVQDYPDSKKEKKDKPNPDRPVTYKPKPKKVSENPASSSYKLCGKTKQDIIRQFNSINGYKQANEFISQLNDCWLNTDTPSAIVLIGTKNKPSIQEIRVGVEQGLDKEDLYEFLLEKLELREQLNVVSTITEGLAAKSNFDVTISDDGEIAIMNRKLSTSYVLQPRKRIARTLFKAYKNNAEVPVSVTIFEGEIN